MTANGVLLLCKQRWWNWTRKVHLGIKQEATGTCHTIKKLPPQKHSKENFIVIFDQLSVHVCVCVCVH